MMKGVNTMKGKIVVLVVMTIVFISACIPNPDSISKLPTSTLIHQTQALETKPVDTPPLEVQESITPDPNPQEDASLTPSKTSLSKPSLKPTLLEVNYNKFPLYFLSNNCVNLTENGLAQMVVVNNKIYYSAMNNHQNLYEMSTDFTAERVIYSSAYGNGFINTFPLMITGDWLVFADSYSPMDVGPWNLLALNSITDQLVTIATSETDKTLLINLYPAVSENKVYWTENVLNDLGDLAKPSIIHAFNLEDFTQEVVFSANTLESVITIIDVSGDYLILEKDPMKCPDKTILPLQLYDLRSGDQVVIPEASLGSMPSISYPYLVWKNAFRFDGVRDVSIYNIQTGHLEIIEVPGIYVTDPVVSQGFIKLRYGVFNDKKEFEPAFGLFDLERFRLDIYDSGARNTASTDPIIDGDTLYWKYRTNISTAKNITFLCKMPFPMQDE